MAIVIPDVGKVRILEWLLEATDPAALKVGLFLNDETIDADSVYGDFTLTVTEGLSHKVLAEGSWTVGSADPATATYDAEQSWTSTGATHTLYGYLIWDDTDDTIMWGENWAASEATYNGKITALTPYLTLTNA